MANLSDPITLLLREVAAAGVRLLPDGDELTIDGPERAVVPLLARLREHKAALVAALRANPQAGAPPNVRTLADGPADGRGVKLSDLRRQEDAAFRRWVQGLDD